MVIRVLPRLNDNNDGDDSIIYIYAAANASSSTKAADNDDKNEDDEEGMNIINAITAYYRLKGHVVHHDHCPSVEDYLQNHGIVDDNKLLLLPLASVDPAILAEGKRLLLAASSDRPSSSPPKDPSGIYSIHRWKDAPVQVVNIVDRCYDNATDDDVSELGNLTLATDDFLSQVPAATNTTVANRSTTAAGNTWILQELMESMEEDHSKNNNSNNSTTTHPR